VSHRQTYGTAVKTATSKDTCYEDKCSLLQNEEGTHVSYWHKSDTTPFITRSHFAHQFNDAKRKRHDLCKGQQR